MEVTVNVGDIVAKDQPLARFSTGIPAADVALAEAAVSQAEANVALARDKAARTRQLKNAGHISQELMMEHEANEKIADAQLASAKAQLQLQRLRLLHTDVLSPDAGVISSRTATVGTVVNAGTELFRLFRQQRLEWRATVAADQLSRITAGQTVEIKLTSLPSIIGSVRQISPAVDPGTLNGTVYIDLPEHAALRAGMFASGCLLLPTRPAFHVPESSLVFRDGFQYVMIVDASNRVHQKKISTGRRHDRYVEILGESVIAADRIVRSGGNFLNDGDTVRVAGTKAP